MSSDKNASFAFETSVTKQTKNLILIDWLTVTCFGFSVGDAIDLLGMQQCPFEDIPRGMNGYPARKFWNGVTIMYGADDPSLVPIDKLRDDMGICINLSGVGCRSFETYGRNDWSFLFSKFNTFTSKVREKNGRKFSFNVTRLDLAFDDHEGTFDIYLLASKVKDCEYISPFKYSSITWSNDQDEDLQGLNINIGSPSSDVLFRIYDKAAERGFKDRHWIRLELQVRHERAVHLANDLLSMSTGEVLRGVCAQYLRFIDPGLDSNKSRWPVSDFWSRFLDGVSKIQLWTAPGSEYNIAKSEYYLFKQYTPLLATLFYIYDDSYIADRVLGSIDFDHLDSKYQNIIRSKMMENIR